MLDWNLFNASDFGVSQLRPRVVFVAVQKDSAKGFSWPTTTGKTPQTVGQTLYDLMTEKG